MNRPTDTALAHVRYEPERITPPPAPALPPIVVFCNSRIEGLDKVLCGAGAARGYTTVWDCSDRELTPREWIGPVLHDDETDAKAMLNDAGKAGTRPWLAALDTLKTRRYDARKQNPRAMVGGYDEPHIGSGQRFVFDAASMMQRELFAVNCADFLAPSLYLASEEDSAQLWWRYSAAFCMGLCGRRPVLPLVRECTSNLRPLAPATLSFQASLVFDITGHVAPWFSDSFLAYATLQPGPQFNDKTNAGIVAAHKAYGDLKPDDVAPMFLRTVAETLAVIGAAIA